MHDVAAAIAIVPATLVVFVLLATRVWLVYADRVAGRRLQKLIGLEAAEAQNLRAGRRFAFGFSALAISLVLVIVLDSLGRPDGTFALLLALGSLLFAAAWLGALPLMTRPRGQGSDEDA